MTIELQAGTDTSPQHLYEIFRAALEEQVNVVRGEPWNENREQTQFLNQPDLQSIHLIIKQEQCVGYIDIRNNDNASFIHLMVITPQYQRMGIGSCVLNLLKEKNATHKPIELTVFKSNYDAQKFYARHHFHITEERKHHYLMRWTPK